MMIQLDLRSEVPIYMQLKHKIIAGIAGKELASGEVLPSVRTMAADLGINMQTVNKTYQLLKKDGYILIHRQKGVVVNPDNLPKADADYLAGLKRDLWPVISEAICRGLEESRFLALCGQVYADIQNVKQEA